MHGLFSENLPTHSPRSPHQSVRPRGKRFVPLVAVCVFFEAPAAIVHHRDSHRNLAWHPIPQPRQHTGSRGGFSAGEVFKNTQGEEKNCIAHLPDVGARGPASPPDVGTRGTTTPPDVGTRRPNLPPHTNTWSGRASRCTHEEHMKTQVNYGSF